MHPAWPVALRPLLLALALPVPDISCGHPGALNFEEGAPCLPRPVARLCCVAVSAALRRMLLVRGVRRAHGVEIAALGVGADAGNLPSTVRRLHVLPIAHREQVAVFRAEGAP